MGSKKSKAIEDETVYDTELYFPVADNILPIVYDDVYNITFAGMEKLHPFDSCKWRNIVNILKEAGYLTMDTIIHPCEATEQDLLTVHTPGYLNSLTYSAKVALITEVPPVALLPNFIVQSRLLSRFRYHVGGTVIATRTAFERGWGINIGGGFHHCSSNEGGGFCAYADITIAIRYLRRYEPRVKRVMIVDLDAHQGNGHEHDFMGDEDVYILDVYNASIYPHDEKAKHAINRCVELRPRTRDKSYLNKVEANLAAALDEFSADFIMYNAGTDILEGDPLGCLNVTAAGVIRRDEMVFEVARERGIPVAMVTSGGYQRHTAQVIADSILNMDHKGLLPHTR